MAKVDQHTVETLQLMAPGASRVDAKTVHGWVLSGQIFSDFSEQERAAIWKNLQSFDGLIPTLYTFFEDFKYLESCANCVKRLFVLSPHRPTVCSTMEYMFPDTNQSDEECIIQTSEFSFKRKPGTQQERLDLGYRQIWLYAMRHYPDMGRECQREDVLAKPTNEKADENALYELAVLARQLGFESPQISKLVDQSPDREIARSALLKARKPCRYQYDARTLEHLVDQIVQCFSMAVPCTSGSSYELVADSSVMSKARCGLPQVQTHRQDSPHLFVDQLHTDGVEVADKITTLFVRRCVYFAFLGKPSLYGSNDRDLRGQSLAEDSPLNVSISPLFYRDSPIGGERSEDHSEQREHQERERLEQERRAQERQEEERLERFEHERREQERREQERREQERREQERLAARTIRARTIA